MDQLIVPVGLEMIKSRLSVVSDKFIPMFNPTEFGCDDNGNLTIDDALYSEKTTTGDFILFLGVTSKPDEKYLAYASFCALSKLRCLKKNNC